MSSSDTTVTPFVRTTGLDVAEESPQSLRERVLDSEVDRLRGKVATLQDELEGRDDRITELEMALASKTEELETTRKWAQFLDRELDEYRERVETLEERVESLEAGDEDGASTETAASTSPGLFARLRSLL